MENLKEEISNSPNLNKIGTMINVLTKFPFNNIKEIKQLYFCDGFKLNSGVYIDDLEEKEPVYLIEINYFDETLLSSENMKPILNELIKESKSNNPYVLKRKGIYYDINMNIMFFIYLAGDTKLFIEESSLNFFQNEENKNVLMLQIFYNFCQIVKIEHLNKREMSLIHPFLLFSNNESIYTIDHAFSLLKPCINTYSNFTISYYFGFFDIEIIEAIEISKGDKSDLYLKPDILLLCALLVYLYRPMITKSSFNFDLILLEISKDFIYKDKNKRLPKLLNLIRENENIKRICSSVLSIDYEEISDIERLIKQVVKHYANVSIPNLQCNCDISQLFQESNPMLKIICLNCGDIHCQKCQKETSHSCQNDKNHTVRIKQKLKYEFEVKTIRFDNIPEIKEKKIIESFSDTIKKIYAEFEDKNDVSYRKIKMIEQFIENFTNYIERKIKSYDESKFEELIKEIRILKSTGNLNTKSSGNVISNKFYQRLITNKAIKLQESFNIKDKWELLSKEIDEFSLFLKDSSDMLNVLLYDRSIQQITQVAKARMLDFQRLIDQEFFTIYRSSVNELITEIIQLYTNKGINPISCDNIINEYLLNQDPTNKFYYTQYFIFYSNTISLFDVDTKIETEIKLETKDGTTTRPIHISFIGKNYRYLHLKTGIVITGGKGSKKVFFIYFNEIREKVHLVKELPELETVHEKHMMLSFNTFNIIVIGGISNSACEMYNFAFKKWENLPSLHTPCFDACVYLYNGQYIYVFGGMVDIDNFSDKIEVLDMNNIEAQWAIKQFNCGDNVLQNFRLCGIKKMEKDENSVCILGGETNTGNTFESIEIMQKFNFETYSLEIINQNAKPSSYEECLLLEIGPNEYIM